MKGNNIIKKKIVKGLIMWFVMGQCQGEQNNNNYGQCCSVLHALPEVIAWLDEMQAIVTV